MQSPLLPWEVIERAIGHSDDHRETLHNFSLTCRDLRPRALCLLVAHVVFKRRPPIFDFCDFLQAKPHLKPLVRSIAVNPSDFAPFPLLSILPNLSTLTFTDAHAQLDPGQPGTIPVLNQSSLTCCKLLGTHIQTLHFSQLSFPTYLDFARVLLVFANVTHLVCSNVVVKAEGNQAALDLIKQRLSKRLHLLSIDIDFSKLSEFYETVYDKPSVAALLLDSGLVQSTVETVIVQKPYRSRGFPHLPHPRSRGLPHPLGWPQLRSLVLKMEFFHSDVIGALVFLENFPPSTLTDVMVELLSVSFYAFIRLLSGKDNSVRWKALEQALLRFPQPRIVCYVNDLHDAHSFWTEESRRWFPALCQREAFTLISKTVTPGAGHDDTVWALTPSPDGKWVATGSWDSTIILWNHIDGTIARRWAAHSYKIVTFLAFSPDGRYLLSCGGDSKIKIWDLTGGSDSLELATTLEEYASHFYSCGAWSPNGGVIASAYNQTIRLWDTRTFHQLHELKHADDVDIEAIAFSRDGRWLASGCRSSYDIWNVASGTLHKSFPTRPNATGSPSIALAFDPKGGMRLVIVPEYSVVKILDVETGEELAVLRGSYKLWKVAFSPDGSLVTGVSNGTVKLWDAYTGVELLSLEGHKKRVNQARVSPCGKYVASASDGGTVRLWRTNDGSCVMTFSEHKNSNVLHVAFSPDGKTLWSADDDGMVIMRRMRDIIPTDEQGP